jgi:glycine/D-amino acid oxidase-like deaminating enzyme
MNAPTTETHTDVAVIGAGFAGAATAYWLKRLAGVCVAVLEQEAVPGAHASGKNAGIARQAAESMPSTLMCARGAAFLRNPPADFSDQRLMDPTGGYLLASKLSDVDELRSRALAAGVDVHVAEKPDVLARVPFLEGASFESALFCPGDGVVDIHALFMAYLRGQQVITDAAVTGFEAKGKRLTAVTTSRGSVTADWFVIAAGAWAAEVGKLAGADGFSLEPRRRHLLHTGPMPNIDPHSPYAWSLDPEVYVRPESGGLLLCPCDEERFPPCGPCSDPEAPVWLAEKLSAAMPALLNVPIARTWAELRCFSNDGNFVVGRDARIGNLLWVCALGGHGMTSSAAVGELAANLLLGVTPALDPAPYRPDRFA